MDKQYSKQFFSSFVLAIQHVCKTYLDFDEMVEVSGYVSVEIDNSQKERYLLCELIHASGNMFSESYCTKAFKTMKSFHRPTDEGVRYRKKRRNTDSLDLPLESLIPQKSLCATSGSDCSLGTYRSHAGGAQSDTICNCSLSRDSSPMPVLPKSVREAEQTRPSDFHHASYRASPSPLSTSQMSKTLSRGTSMTEVASCSSQSCIAHQASVTNSSGKANMLVDGKSSGRSTQTGSNRPGKIPSASEEAEMDPPHLTPIDNSGVSNREMDNMEGKVASWFSLTRNKKPQSRRSKARGARMKTSPLVSDIEMRQNNCSAPDIEANHAASHYSSPPTMDTSQPKVSLCKIPRLICSQRAVPRKVIESSQTLTPGPPIRNAPSSTVLRSESQRSGYKPKDADAEEDVQGYSYAGHISDCSCVREGTHHNHSCTQDESSGKAVSKAGSSCKGGPEDLDGESGADEDTATDLKVSFGKDSLGLPKDIVNTMEGSQSPTREENKASDCKSNFEFIEMNRDGSEKRMESVLTVESDTEEQHIPVDLIKTCSSPANIDQNQHSAKKTRFHMKLFNNHLRNLGDTRPAHTMPCTELDSYIGTFLASVRRDNGEDYGPTTLAGIHASIDRHLRKMQYPYSIKRDSEFLPSRKLLIARQQGLTAKGIGQKTRKIDVITKREVDILYAKEQLGTESADALLNTVWFMNNIHFGIIYSVNHYNLLWGDIQLHADSKGQEYLQMVGKVPNAGNSDYRVYARTDDTTRCFVNTYKKYRSVRPEETCRHDAPFYLTVNHFHGDQQPWFKFQNVGVNKLGSLMRRMAAFAGLDKDRFTSTAVKLSDEKKE